MIETRETVIERIAVARGKGEPLAELATEAAACLSASADSIGGVIAATFSNPDRFPSLAVRVAANLAIPPSTPAFDIQMACSAYPYAVYLAGKMASDTGKKILVVDGDVKPIRQPRSSRTTRTREPFPGSRSKVRPASATAGPYSSASVSSSGASSSGASFTG